MDYGLIFYVVGAVLALIIGCVELYNANKVKENYDEFPGVLCCMVLLSWFTIAIYSIQYCKKYVKI